MRTKMKRINKKTKRLYACQNSIQKSGEKITDRVTLWLYVSNAEANEKGLGKILIIRE